MKIRHAFLALPGLFFLPAKGQDRAAEANLAPVEIATSKWEVEIPQPIADGTHSTPTEKPAPINFEIISSRTTVMDVVKAPEMEDLPPITGRINVTVQMVEDPGLAEPLEPLPVLEPQDPAVVARMEELQEKYRGTSLVFLSASVYDHKRTLLRIHTHPGQNGEVTAWSNLNFNHFSGFSTYRVKDGVDGTLHDFGILMGLGNEDTERLAELSTRSDWQYDSPEIPEFHDLAEVGPAFVVTKGEEGSPAMDILEQLHDLYRKEGAKMEAAYHAREKARAERKAYLLENPPKPSDVTVRFWNRNPAPSTQDQTQSPNSAR